MQGTAPVFQHNALSKSAGPQASTVALSETRSQATHGLVMQSLADNVVSDYNTGTRPATMQATSVADSSNCCCSLECCSWC